jgi:hypothetical protein
MKKISLFVGVLFVVVAGKMSAETIIYKNPASNQATTLTLQKGCGIKEIDSEKVNWKAPETEDLTVVIPAGAHNILAYKNSLQKEISMNFIAGANYDIKIQNGEIVGIKKSEDTPKKAAGASTSSSNSGRVWVKGYYRKDGTYVRGHYRRK